MRIFFCLIMISCMLALTALADAPKHNVLFLISDDLNTALGCYNDSIVKTPNIDALAQRGILYERAYCQYPLCNPSRASILTGMLPDNTGVLDNKKHFRQNHPQTITLPQLFREAGAFSARVGKLYHYGVPREIGTDGEMNDPLSWMQTINPRGRDKDEEDITFSLEPGNFGGTLSWLAAEGADEEQTDGIGATEAIEQLEKLKARQPFFLGVGFYRPHTPFVAPKKYFDLYDKTSLPVEPVPKEEDRVPPGAYGGQKKEHDLLTDDLRREARQAYYASVSFMDAQVGRVIDALDRLGLTENTIIVMTSDHGYHLGEHGLWQKQSVFEEAARVPLIVSIPGMENAGQRSNQLVELLDLYPTLAKACGLEPPKNVDGQNLLPLMEDLDAPGRGYAMTQVFHKNFGYPGYSVRDTRYRYTEWGENGEFGKELYDHQTDPYEMENLAGNPEFQDAERTMHKILQEAQSRQNIHERPKIEN